MTREEALELEIVELQQDYDDICEFIHEHGGCEWCEQHCKVKKEVGIDRDCVRKYIDLKYLAPPEKTKKDAEKFELLINGDAVFNSIDKDTISGECDRIEIKRYTVRNYIGTEIPSTSGLLTLYSCSEEIIDFAKPYMRFVSIKSIKNAKRTDIYFDLQIIKNNKPIREYVNCQVDSWCEDDKTLVVYFECSIPI